MVIWAHEPDGISGGRAEPAPPHYSLAFGSGARMKSARRGRRTLDAEVANVSGNGLWLLLDGQECFLSSDHFPWFREGSIGQLVVS